MKRNTNILAALAALTGAICIAALFAGAASAQPPAAIPFQDSLGQAAVRDKNGQKRGTHHIGTKTGDTPH